MDRDLASHSEKGNERRWLESAHLAHAFVSIVHSLNQGPSWRRAAQLGHTCGALQGLAMAVLGGDYWVICSPTTHGISNGVLRKCVGTIGAVFFTPRWNFDRR